MISLYSGTPGSGKSLHIAQILFTRCRFGRCTIANFDINYENIDIKNDCFFYVDNQDLTPEYLVNFSEQYFEFHKFKEGSILLVIDECQILFNCRDWQAKNRNQWIKFFTQHRKLGYNIILVSQFDRMIDRQIRSLIEYEFIHRKVSNFGLKGKILSSFALGKLFIAVQRWYPLGEKCGQEFFLYHKKYSDIYDSYKMFEDISGNKKEMVEPDSSSDHFEIIYI